jgi:hypothetical protein
MKALLLLPPLHVTPFSVRQRASSAAITSAGVSAPRGITRTSHAAECESNSLMHVCMRNPSLPCLCLCPVLCAPLDSSACKDAWDAHGSSSGGYYVCNRYDASVKDGKLSAEEQSMINNQKLPQKYTYYYKRYKSSWDGAMLTRKLSDTLERTMRN